MSTDTQDKLHFSQPILQNHPSLRPVVETPKQAANQGAHSTLTTEEEAFYAAKKARYDARREACREEGFDVGAVIVPRLPNRFMYLGNVENWGIVSMLAHYHTDEDKYKPIKVTWPNKFKKESYHEMDELYLIMPNIPDDDLKLMFEAQERELRDGIE